jgi:hypothetical protein
MAPHSLAVIIIRMTALFCVAYLDLNKFHKRLFQTALGRFFFEQKLAAFLIDLSFLPSCKQVWKSCENVAAASLKMFL